MAQRTCCWLFYFATLFMPMYQYDMYYRNQQQSSDSTTSHSNYVSTHCELSNQQKLSAMMSNLPFIQICPSISTSKHWNESKIQSSRFTNDPSEIYLINSNLTIYSDPILQTFNHSYNKGTIYDNHFAHNRVLHGINNNVSHAIYIRRIANMYHAETEISTQEPMENHLHDMIHVQLGEYWLNSTNYLLSPSLVTSYKHLHQAVICPTIVEGDHVLFDKYHHRREYFQATTTKRSYNETPMNYNYHISLIVPNYATVGINYITINNKTLYSLHTSQSLSHSIHHLSIQPLSYSRNTDCNYISDIYVYILFMALIVLLPFRITLSHISSHSAWTILLITALFLLRSTNPEPSMFISN